MSKFGSIIFPLGFVGNHIRWLLFLDNKFYSPFCNQDLQSKIDFIREKVYNPNTRTWNSWLILEWKYRQELDNQLLVRHDQYNWENSTAEKELYLSCQDYESPFVHYHHINLGLNNTTPDILLTQHKKWYHEFEFINRRIQEFPNKKIILIDRFFDPVLPKNLYQEITSFFNFENCYDAAQEIHNMHHQCRKQSAKDFYNYFTSNSFQDFLQKVKTISNN